MNFRALIVFAAIAVSVVVQAQSSQQAALAARQWRTAHETEILKQFTTLLSIPNVVSDPAQCQAAITESLDRIETMAALMQMEWNGVAGRRSPNPMPRSVGSPESPMGNAGPISPRATIDGPRKQRTSPAVDHPRADARLDAHRHAPRTAVPFQSALG